MIVLAPDVDLSRAWQVQETGSKIELFQLAANIFLYAVDKKEVHEGPDISGGDRSAHRRSSSSHWRG